MKAADYKRISAMLMAGAAAGTGSGFATAQDFARPPLDPPPIPAGTSTADLSRHYRVSQARQAATRGAALPKGVLPDGSGNVVVLGRVNGDIVLTAPRGKPK